MQPDDYILVGDVGGTNVRLGLASRKTSGHIDIEQFFKIRGDDVDSLEEAISQFFTQTVYKPKRASIAIAGPISNRKVQLTNRPWAFSEQSLAKQFGFQSVRLFNDFSAMARSVPELSKEDLQPIKAGTAQSGEPILVAGAGTGFGVAKLSQYAGRWAVFGSEGGHIAYAPQTSEEREICAILEKDHDFISLELISSGQGMNTLHRAICTRHGQTYTQQKPEDIRQLANAGDPVCLELCNMRSAAIMGAIGDMALILGARGGIVLAGTVSERMVEFITHPTALKRFSNRGVMSNYMTDIPITLLSDPIAPLIGAAGLYLDAIT